MKVIKWFIVTIVATVLTTIGINAFDNIGNPARSLLGSVFYANAKPCPSDMVLVSTSEKGFCIDKYEASTGKSCLYKDPQNKKETEDNLALPGCVPVSASLATPWRNIARYQAEFACAKDKKRLPSNKEWYRAALGMIDKSEGWGPRDCNVDNKGAEDPDLTGSRELCVSPVGAYDMIGNVWEWTDETIYDGTYDARNLPDIGYVKSIDNEGIPIKTDTENSDTSFFEDYFWIDATDIRGVFRGGYWGNQTDAGQYTVNATVPPSFVGNAVGFRCVKDAVLK